ncbi:MULTISPECIES: AAA family ATPase [Streptomyces]|uniref:AAA family ATPase n=1 Tax=Streptomyces TaxID=1883 RepID=UPI000FFE9CCE|nr:MULTISPECIES: AAA family ATPase [Streptomyces]
MRSISQVQINGLFGYVDQDIHFTEDSPITIISGPNGTGKTHFLRLLHALIRLEIDNLASVEFSQIEVKFTDGSMLKVAQKSTEGDVEGFELSAKRPGGRKFQGIEIPYRTTRPGGESIEMPDWVAQLPDGNWYDQRLERIMPPEMVRRYRLPNKYHQVTLVRGNPWLTEIYKDAKSILVDTQRLDAIPQYGNRAQNRTVSMKQGGTLTRIRLYIEQVAAQLEDARRASLEESLDADQTFAARVLQKARTTINEKDLKERYQRIAELHAELHASGLSIRRADVRFPEEKTTPTERRILNVFLDDWQRKLIPLLPIHEKLKSLRRIVETKFIGKELVLTSKGRIGFKSKVNGRTVPVTSLSSGEQHLLAVFSMLLFSAEKGAVVLIDEPEISMHATWKHSFLDDIAEVAKLSDLQIVIATHSSAIINGQWDLVEEIEPPEVPESAVDELGPEEDMDGEI